MLPGLDLYLYRSCTTRHNIRLGSTVVDDFVRRDSDHSALGRLDRFASLKRSCNSVIVKVESSDHSAAPDRYSSARVWSVSGAITVSLF